MQGSSRATVSSAGHNSSDVSQDRGRLSSIPVESLLARRGASIGPSLSLSYAKKLHIVRGEGTYLFDDAGNRYLDCVNNVCHVGHCNPRVVAAACDQLHELNTNTRYLHSNLLEFAELLKSTLPPALEVVYVVNSGSEANDLALRMASAATGGSDVICIDSAYHGHTAAVMDVSPYKFKRRGGFAQPPHVHVVPLPDVYRGLHRDASDPGAAYASHVEDACRVAGRRVGGTGVSAFICESMLSCGGQVLPPPGFMARSYHAVRAAGGVCIADEVQVGCGRVGSHMWGFQMHDVVPDIVTIGKPIGNGFPLAVVVCTREVASAFSKGPEYFNTFGGNPVACAVGREVLRCISDMGLQANARDTGAYLLERLSELKDRFPVIGDVRGVGLFVGLELVKHRDTRVPDAEAAHFVVNRCRDEHRVLLSTDGFDGNVIKAKPPLVFGRAEADMMVAALGEAFGEWERSHGTGVARL